MSDLIPLYRAAVVAGAAVVVAGGSAGATTLTVQRATVPLAMNQQASAVESAVSRAAQQRFAPVNKSVGQGTSTRQFSAWLDEDLRYVDIDGSSSGGLSGNVLGGGDVALGSSVSAGLLLGYSLTDFDTQFAGADGDFESQAFVVGPYVTVGLGNSMYLDAFALYSRSNYDMLQAGLSGDTESNRILGGIGLGAAYDLGAVIFQPTVDFSISHDSQNGYVDTGPTVVASRDTTLFRGSAAAKFGQVYSFDGIDLHPWGSAGLEVTADNAGSSSVVGDGVSARVGAGLGMIYGPLEMSFEVDAAGLGSQDFFDVGGRFTLSYVFY